MGYQWVQHFDNADWSPNNGTWDGTKWLLGSDLNIELVPIGTWANGYRPTKMRVTFEGGGTVNMCIPDGVPYQFIVENSSYSSAGEETCAFSSYDISKYVHTGAGANITNIEFEEYTSDIEAETSEGIGFADQVDGVSLTDTLEEGIGFADQVDGVSLTDTLEEGIGFQDELSPAGSTFSVTLNEGIGFDDAPEFVLEIFRSLAEGIGFDDANERFIEICRETSEGIGFTDADEGFNWTKWLEANRNRAKTRFYLTLTGAEDGEDDVEIPMSSFQGRFRSGDPSYMAAVVPGMDYVSEINARPNGELIIEMAFVVADQESLREEIARVNFENVRIDEGAKQKTLTLTGHKTESYDAQIVTLTGNNYRYLSEGALRYRGFPDLYLRPGNTVIAGDDEFIAGYVWLSVGAREQIMEVSQQMDGLDWDMPFTSGGTYQVKVGDIITGAVSGETATIGGVRLTSGSWAAGDAAGTFVIGDLTGDIGAENLNVGAETNVATTTGVVC